MRILTSAITSLLMLGTASAADMMRPVYKAPVAPALASTWTGFYAGVNVGGAAAKSDLDFSIAGGPTFASIDNAFSGIAGGAQIGYNWQFGSFVAGFETDFQGSNLKGSLVAPCAAAFCVPAGLSASYSQSIPWFGTARARLGYAQDSWLIYATGGYAYANLETNAVATAGPLVASFSQREIRSGWTVGAGIEVGLAPNWSAKLEYLYADFGNVRTTWLPPAVPLLPALPALNDDARVTMNVVRAGVNYRF
jgi:outer membrane immunogenic protein